MAKTPLHFYETTEVDSYGHKSLYCELWVDDDTDVFQHVLEAKDAVKEPNNYICIGTSGMDKGGCHWSLPRTKIANKAVSKVLSWLKANKGYVIVREKNPAPRSRLSL